MKEIVYFQATYSNGIGSNSRPWSAFDPATHLFWHHWSTRIAIDTFKLNNELHVKFHDELKDDDVSILPAMRYFMPFTRKEWMDEKLHTINQEN